MSASRETILRSLKEARQPFADAPSAPDEYVPMVLVEERDNASLTERFVAEAEKLSCIVHRPPSPSAAVEALLEIVGEDKAIMSWETEMLPIPGLTETLSQAGISMASPDDPEIRVGVSGADAALAATGSLVLASGPGKYRNASLLPPLHVAVITTSQILPDMESWVEAQSSDDLATLRDSSNVVIVSGASRTADIAMELILGMHGPGEMHIILIEE